MGHDISLKINEEELNCFPVIGEGTYACDVIDGNLVPKTLQSGLYITYNLSKIWYLAMENIGHPVDSTGDWLNNAKAKDILPILEKLFDEIISKPQTYEPLEPKADPDTGERWGSYSSFCDKIYALIFACRKYPEAIIYDWF